MKLQHLAIILIATGLTGCATTYYNPNIKDPVALERQRAIDEGQCKRVSYGTAPMPAVRVYQPQQQSYTVTGTVNSYNQYSGYSNSNYTATVQPRQNFATGFASGMANGAAMGAAIAASQAEEKIFHGCMLSLGWTKDQNEKAKEIIQPQRQKISAKNFDYGNFLKKAYGWRRGDLDDGNYSIGTFDIPDVDKHIVGMLILNEYAPPKKFGDLMADRFLQYRAINCRDKTTAILATALFEREKIVDSEFSEEISFQKPSALNQKAIDTHCQQ